MRTAFVPVVGVLALVAATACFEDSEPGTTGADSGDGSSGGGSSSTAGSLTTGVDSGTTGTTPSTTESGADSGTTDDGVDTSGTGPEATGWSQRLSTVVQILEGETPEDAGLADVPVLVRLTQERFDYSAAAPDGSDLRFVPNLEARFALPHEIEQWDPSGTSLIWVRVPALATAAMRPDEFWLLYGDTEVNPWPDARDVWSDGFVGVWHFSGEGPPASFEDSTAEGNLMVPEGDDAEYGLDAGPGGFGPALDIGESSRMVVANAPSLGLGTPLTMEAWVRPSAVSMTNNHREIIDKSGAYRLIASSLTSGRPFANILNTDGMEITRSGSEPLPTSTWTHMVGTYDGQALRLYLDGEFMGQSGSKTGASSSTSGLQIGSLYDGRIDEVRVSAAARSNTWIEVQRLSMLDELLTYDDPEPLPAGP